jgi:hypothetical protein
MPLFRLLGLFGLFANEEGFDFGPEDDNTADARSKNDLDQNAAAARIDVSDNHVVSFRFGAGAGNGLNDV